MSEAAEAMRDLMLGPKLERDLALSLALEEGKLCSQAIFRGLVIPIDALAGCVDALAAVEATL